MTARSLFAMLLPLPLYLSLWFLFPYLLLLLLLPRLDPPPFLLLLLYLLMLLERRDSCACWSSHDPQVRSQVRLVDVEMMATRLAKLTGKEPLLLPKNIREEALETAQESVIDMPTSNPFSSACLVLPTAAANAPHTDERHKRKTRSSDDDCCLLRPSLHEAS